MREAYQLVAMCMYMQVLESYISVCKLFIGWDLQKKLGKFSLWWTIVEGTDLSCRSGLLDGGLLQKGGFRCEWDLICC